MKLIIKIENRLLFFKYFKKFRLNFEIAKVKEVLEFLEYLEKNKLSDWVLSFIQEKTKQKINDKYKLKILENHESIFLILKDNYFKWVFGEVKTNSTKKETAPLSSTIVFACKEGGVNGYDLLYKMTFEDLKIFIEGAVWNLNEQSKKGQKTNRLSLINKKATDRTEEEKENIRKKLLILQNV